jgi:hypothetical protein
VQRLSAAYNAKLRFCWNASVMPVTARANRPDYRGMDMYKTVRITMQRALARVPRVRVGRYLHSLSSIAARSYQP